MTPYRGAVELLTVRVTQVPENMTVVDARGEVDIMTVGRLEEGLAEARGFGNAVVLSLGHTTYLDGRGIRVIEGAAARFKNSGQGFVLAGSLPTIHKLLKLCFEDQIPIVGTVEEGLAYLRRGLPTHLDGGDNGGNT